MVFFRLLGALALLGAASALPDDSVLIQQSARLIESEEEEEATGPEFDVLANADADMEDETNLKMMINLVRNLRNDLKVALATNNKDVYSEVTEADVRKAEEYTLALEEQQRQVKGNKVAMYPRKLKKMKYSYPLIRHFAVQTKKELYPSPDAVGYIFTKSGRFCMQGPLFYMRRVLVKLQKSPLQYGWNNAMVLNGECSKEAGHYTLKPPKQQECFKEATVYLFDNSTTTLKKYNTFSTRAVHQWMKVNKKTTEDAHNDLHYYLCKVDKK